MTATARDLPAMIRAALTRVATLIGQRPVAVTFAGLLVVVAIGLAVTPAHAGAGRLVFGTGYESVVENRHWWSPITAVFLVDPGLELALAVVAALLVLGAAERLLGPVRLLIAFTVTAVVGTVAGILVQNVGVARGELWSVGVSELAAVDPFTPIAGSIMAASAFTAPLWRRRIRVLTLAAALVLVLYSGQPSDLYRLLAVVVGLGLGMLLRPQEVHASWRRSSDHETRTLLAAIVGMLAVGPVVTIVSGARYGLLAPLGLVMAQDVPAPGGRVVRCLLGDITEQCLQELTLDRFNGLAPLLISLIPLTALVVAAVGMARGRRWAVWLAIGVNAAIAVLTGWYYGVLPGAGLASTWRGQGQYGEIALVLVVSVLVPAVTVVVLLANLQRFPRRPPDPPQRPEVDGLRALLQAGGGGSLAHMATWVGNTVWFNHEGTVAIAYRVVNGVAITTGEPVVSPRLAADVGIAAVGDFARMCDHHGWTPVFYSVHRPWEDTFRAMGWRLMTVAEETILRPRTWATTGKKWQDIRSAISRAAREGVRAEWTSYPELDDRHAAQITEISGQWVQDKALPELGFTLGGLRELRDPAVRLMLALDVEDRVQAVTSWLPSYRDGIVIGWTLDFMRRRSDSMNGVMEFIIAQTASLMRNSPEIEFLSLSAAPLAPGPTPEAEGSAARLLEFLGGILEPVYGFRSLLAFKRKFQPEFEPLLMAYPDPVALPAIGVALARAYLPALSLSETVRIARSRG